MGMEQFVINACLLIRFALAFLPAAVFTDWLFYRWCVKEGRVDDYLVNRIMMFSGQGGEWGVQLMHLRSEPQHVVAGLVVLGFAYWALGFVSAPVCAWLVALVA